MRVVKEAWLLERQDSEKIGEFMLMQNTTTPKLYVSEASAKSAADYHACQHNNGVIVYKPIKAFLVVEDDIPF